MDLNKLNFSTYIIKLFPTALSYTVDGELYLKVNKSNIKQLLLFLKIHTNALFSQMIDCYGVDYSERVRRFEICYNLLSIQKNNRITVTTSLAEHEMIDTATDVYPNLGWYEREVYDMYGVLFCGNLDLRRILTDYGFKGHPLRKDFPLTGYIEVRYDDFGKRIRYEHVSLSQEYRNFTLKNPWQSW